MRTPEQQAARDYLEANQLDPRAYRCPRHPDFPLVQTIEVGVLYCGLCQTSKTEKSLEPR